MVARLKLRWGCVLAVAALPQLTMRPLAQSSAETAVSILQRKCLQCHGETLRMSGLDLRTREALLKGGDKGPAIVPGDADASRAYRRVAGLEQPVMPMAPLPPLSADERAILKAWINQGAKWEPSNATEAQPSGAPSLPNPKGQSKVSTAGGYRNEDHERPITEEERKWWAFQKPIRHAIPKVKDDRWSAHPIDAFIKKA